MEPVKLCISSKESPNFVEPLVKTIDADTNSVWNSCAVNDPPIITSLAIPTPPSIIKAPVDVDVEFVESVISVVPSNRV